uniref:C3H1-type domain-containing protein n=1 Tax=Oncorhynchus tshawytscha TaxID=74940 RepID=A0AAZ3RZ22_ONCTS
QHRTPCVNLGSEGPPDPPSGQPSPGEALREHQSKLEFALKLGYAEGLVLAKLGPYTLIKNILGELVKLGCKGRDKPTGRSDSPYQTDLLLGDKDNLRPVVLDGSNVAMSHGNKEVFSCYGIQLAVDWFLERGHRDITVFVPSWKKEQSRPDALITDQDILRRLEKDKILVFTPSCLVHRFIVKLAYKSDGIIVSNDNYRDLACEKPEWKKLIDERLLMYSVCQRQVRKEFMPPDDPLGRHGPSLENFLRRRPIMPEHKKQPCPYGKRCTYGHKCKYYHPERSAQCQDLCHLHYSCCRIRSPASHWTPTCVCWARQTVAAVTRTERKPPVCAAQALCWTNTSTINSISTINTTACTLNTHTHTSALYGYHQNLARGHSFPLDEPPDPHLKHLLYPLQHQAVGARSSCPGDYPSASQSGPYPAGSPLGRCLANTRLETLSDSRLYERSASPPRKAFSWDPYCSQPPQSYSILPVHAPPPHAPGAPRLEPVRGKVYLNLCNIFPSELVGRVMGRNPDVTDAQQLTASILAEKRARSSTLS